MKERKQAIKTIVGLIVFTVLFIYFVNHAKILVNLFNKIMSLIFPFLLGCAIAFIVNIPMSAIESKFFKNPESKLYSKKRAISMLLSYLFFVVVIGLVVFVVAPEVAETITNIKNKFPSFVDEAKKWSEKYTKNYPEIAEQIAKFNPDLDKVGDIFMSNGATILSTTFSIFSSIIGAIVNTLIGIVFSMYVLVDKEKLGRQAKMLSYAMFKESVADELLVFAKIAHDTFSKFFACQFREGIILGSMFAITMAIVGIPYPLTIGVLIAFTALIPVFGAFIGLFIAMFMLLVVSPKYVLWFVITFFVLQFIENYFIYPKLVGGDIGLSAIWVLLAVLAGGDLMGVVGMFIFIPLVSVFYSYFRSIVYRKLKKKEINVDEKTAPDHAVPLMKNRQRLFAPKQKKYSNEWINEADKGRRGKNRNHESENTGNTKKGKSTKDTGNTSTDSGRDSEAKNNKGTRDNKNERDIKETDISKEEKDK